MLIEEASACLNDAIGKIELAQDSLTAAYRILRGTPTMNALLTDAISGINVAHKKSLAARSLFVRGS